MQVIRPEERCSEAEIILKDEEMNPIIRELIAKAHEKGYCKSNLAKAIVTMWGELYEVQTKPVFSPTDEELKFWLKASKFVEIYKDLIIEAHDEDVDVIRFNNQCKGDEKKEQRILQAVEVFLKAAYCTFCREDNIRKAYVEKYAGLIERNAFSNASIPAQYVYKVIDSKLMYDRNNHYMPEIRGTKEGLVYFYTLKAVDEFCDQYRYSHTIFSNSLMASIWFINTYFH